MHLMTRENLNELLVRHEAPCVSIFMPTIKGSEETKQNPIRYRKLLDEAEKKLTAAGQKPAEAAKFMKAARPLLEDHKFWQYQSGGLALYISRDVKRAYTLPMNFKEMVIVSDHFCVTPVLPLFSEDGRFYVLTLSQERIQLYQCTRYSVAQVDLRQVPKNIAELLELNPKERQLQFHANNEGHAGGSGQAGMFHGHAEDSNESKANILVYFQNVNRGVNSLLKSDRHPLVTAGVDYLTRIYAQANTYNYLAGQSITGSAAGLRPEELRDRAWELVKPIFEKKALAAVGHYEQLLGTPKASNHIKDILQAAEEGRVETLLITANAERWGMYDPVAGEVDLHKSPGLSDTELLDLSASRTLEHGGKVYVLEQSKMPGVAPAAAIYRH